MPIQPLPNPIQHVPLMHYIPQTYVYALLWYIYKGEPRMGTMASKKYHSIFRLYPDLIYILISQYFLPKELNINNVQYCEEDYWYPDKIWTHWVVWSIIISNVGIMNKLVKTSLRTRGTAWWVEEMTSLHCNGPLTPGTLVSYRHNRIQNLRPYMYVW